jgi:hypothetical protein
MLKLRRRLEPAPICVLRHAFNFVIIPGCSGASRRAKLSAAQGMRVRRKMPLLRLATTMGLLNEANPFRPLADSHRFSFRDLPRRESVDP